MTVEFQELLERFDGAIEEGDGWVANCPAHSDSHPSLRVALSDSGRVLVRCRAGCETAKVLEKVGLGWADLRAVSGEAVSRRATSRDVPADPASVAALRVRLDGYESRLDDEVLEYARRRFGVSADAARRLGIGRADDMGGGPRMVVPFADPQGVARGFQARALDQGAKVRWLGPPSPEGASWARLGFFPGGTDWPEVVVTEGPGDALVAASVGFDSIAVRGASLAANENVQEQIRRWAGDRAIVVAGDADRAGDEFASRLVTALTLAGAQARALRPPVDGQDLASWYEVDPDGFDTALIGAVQNTAGQSVRATAARQWTDSDLTDVAAAKRLLRYFEERGSGVKYAPEMGFFLLRDGVWEVDRLDAVRTQAQATAATVWQAVEDLRGLLETTQDQDEQRALISLESKVKAFARHLNSTRGLDSMVRELQALAGVAVDVEKFDSHHHLLAVRNGVIDLRTGSLLEHDAAYLMTRRVDLDFDSTATAPRWRRFLEEIFPAHPALPAYMQRLVGYGVTGQTDEQCFAVLWGTGANGKSVLTDTLTEVFDAITVTTPFSTFEMRPSGGVPNDLAALKGARVVHAAEGEQGRPMAESVLKRVTGRDRIAARFMRKEFFEFRPTFLLMLATNFKPAFRGQDEGLWRRVKLIPFERYFAPDERDHRLGEALLAEAEGILAWAVQGAVEWYANGLGDPTVVKAATTEYRQTSDALAGFLPGVFVLDANTPRLDGSAIFNAYLEWSQEENLPPAEIWTRRRFFGALEERGLTKRKTDKGVAFDGIRRARPGEHGEAIPLEEPKTITPVTSGPSLMEV
jgi:putative DNA primase/helicase